MNMVRHVILPGISAIPAPSVIMRIRIQWTWMSLGMLLSLPRGIPNDRSRAIAAQRMPQLHAPAGEIAHRRVARQLGKAAIRTQEAQTELLVNDGDTIVIGGIVIRDTSWSESRVPFLWRIPILGWLFKNRQINDEKTELLIFLSPSIVTDQKMTQS